MRRSILATIITFGMITTLTSCSSRDEMIPNPFFEEWDTPFGVPPFDRIRPYHFMPALDRAISLHNEEIEAITSSGDAPTFDNTIAALDASGVMLDDVYNVFSALSASDNDGQMQAVEQEFGPRYVSHMDSVTMNPLLFKRIHAVYEQRQSLDLTPLQIRLTEKIHRMFTREGALLDDVQKRRLSEINAAISKLEITFAHNILAANAEFTLELDNSQIGDIDAQTKNIAAQKAQELGLENRYVFTLQKSSMIPFLTQCPDRELRKKIYTAYLERCASGTDHDNAKVLNQILALKNEKAHLLGFESYANYVISDEMAGSVANVYDLLEKIFPDAMGRAGEELAKMDELFDDDFGNDATFEPWDWWYYAEKIRKRDYNLNDDLIKPYFSLQNVRQGVFNLANRLYGITFRPISVPLYNEDVTAVEVLDKDQSHIGVVYFDFYARPEKSQGAWCTMFREQRYSTDGTSRRAPVVAVVFNYAKPIRDTSPTLLDLDEVSTVFHEFGHALHCLFSNVRYNTLLEVEGDFVELPSQVMENWAFHPDIVRTYASNYRSNDVISENLISKINACSKFNQGFAFTELIAAALLDLDAYSMKEYSEIDPEEFTYRMLTKKRHLIPQIEPRYRLPYFLHIFGRGYSAGYYFYIWAEVLEKDAFAAFSEASDITDRRTAELFRHEILEKGGSEDGMVLYRNFRGSGPDRIHMLRARGLVEEETPVVRQDIEYVDEDEQGKITIE